MHVVIVVFVCASVPCDVIIFGKWVTMVGLVGILQNKYFSQQVKPPW